MWTRRAVIGGLVAAPFAGGAAGATGADGPRPGEDGLFHFDWYLESFLDLAEDLAGATARGKRFAVLWGLKGCPACRTMHEVHLTDPAVQSFIRNRFDVLHLNIIGSRPVVDLDGSTVAEKDLAARYGVRGTPTVQFFPAAADGLGGKPPTEREALRMEGLPAPPLFLANFRFVAEGGTGAAAFAAWRAANGV